MRNVPAHWIKPNETTRQPRRWVWLDTEAGETTEGSRRRQRWMLAVTAFDNRTPDTVKPRPTEWAEHNTPAELWQWVTDRTRPHTRTVLVAHNLSYDLRISGAMTELPALGWSLKGVRLDGGQAWATWRRGEASLYMVDSLSWLPVGLDRLAGMVGQRKPPLPGWDAPRDLWAARCRADVSIMRAGYTRVLEWLESRDLGVWQMTGAGMAWSTWRHRFMDTKVLVHADDEVRALERRASWTGRCEAWRWGRLPSGGWHEYDFTMAYAHLAETEAVPVKLIAELDKPTAARLATWARTAAVMAEVTVTTDTPVVPAEIDGRIGWPTGTFETVLWSPEIRLALDNGATVTPRRVWGYRSAPALAAWARWVQELARGDGDGRDPIVALVAKHWSRALIGRFGLRYSSWDHGGRSPVADVQLIPGFDTVTDKPYRLLQVGHDVYWEGEPTDGENACPAVMAWIMSAARARLWAAMNTAGLEHVAYVDTDSLLVDRVGAGRLEAAKSAGLFVNLRRKQSLATVEVHGPRQLVMGRKLKAAGVPSSAELADDGRWVADVWRGLGESVRRGEPNDVIIEERRYRLRGTDRRRLHLAGGLTAPVALGA